VDNMAENNFARSGTADTDLLADDDPLSELARIVGYEPRPVSRPIIEDVPVEPAAEMPVPARADARPASIFALEDELFAEFERYDAPRLDPVDHLESYRQPEPQPELADETAPVEPEAMAEEIAPESWEAPEVVLPELQPDDRSSASSWSPDDASLPSEPVEHYAVSDEADAEAPLFDAPVDWPVLGPVEPVQSEAWPEPSDAEPVESPGAWDNAVAYEPQQSVVLEEETSTASDEQVAASHETAGRSEPVFLGFQPADFPETALSSTDMDLDRELELSLGSSFSDETAADEVDEPQASAFSLPVADRDEAPDPVQESDVDWHAEADLYAGVAPTVSVVEAPDERPDFADMIPQAEDDQPFAAEAIYAEPTVDYDPETTVRHHGSQQHAEEWQVEPTESFHPQPSYDVSGIAPAAESYDLDDLLAEVERFPVPERSGRSLQDVQAVPFEAPSAGAGATFFDKSLFTRATPVARSQSPAEITPEPVVPEAVAEELPVASWREPADIPTVDEPAAIDRVNEPDAVDLAFENFELELDDLDLDLDPADFALDEPEMQAVETAPVSSVDVAATETYRAETKPDVAEDVRWQAPEPAASVAEIEPVVLPFDPSLIGTTEESVTPVFDLDVPHVPVTEKEQPQAYASDYEFDIDAEMAQLFADPAASGQNEGQAGEPEQAAPAALATDFKGGPDEFEKALEEDFRRSMSEPDRVAVPIDASKSGVSYAGDGYDEPTGRGRKILVAACAAGLVVLAGLGAYAWMFGGTTEGSGEPRIILADNDPVKVVPEEKGGKTVPNQDKAVYDRVAGQSEATPQQEQLVTSTEEPIDVVQRTLTPESLPLEGREDDPLDGATPLTEEDNRLLPGIEEASTTSDEGNAAVIAPRKVRTMIVKPDGTLVAREEIVPEPSSDTASAETAGTPAETAGTATETAAAETSDAATTTGLAAPTDGATADATTAETPVDADVSVADTNPAALADDEATATAESSAAATTPLEEVASADVEETAPVRVVRTTTIGANGTVGNTPIPESRPAEQPVSVVGTVTDQGNVREEQAAATPAAEAEPATTTTAETQVAAVNPGGYVIQIASLPSEAEAKRSYDNLSSRFSGVIGGRGVDIRRAEIPNKGTYYRVRIPAGSREDANALCSRYKGAGGSCLVTR
jgi:hypothetical protein